MYARRRNQITTTAGEDEVLFGISLPAESVVNNVSANIHMVGLNSFSPSECGWYAIEGWILPVLDPDSVSTYHVHWNRLVPKDTDTQTFDMDTGAQDTSSFFEPGEADWSQMLDAGLRPRRIYQKIELLSYATSPKPHTESDVTKWTPTAAFKVRIGRRMFVKQPSVMVFAIASPAVDDVTTTEETALAENEWSRVGYLEHVVEQAQMDLLGLADGGTAIAAATDLIQKHLEPDVYNENGGAWRQLTSRVWTDAIIDHSVKGRLGKASITTGR